MVRFDLRLLNFPVEKFFKPRKRLAGINIPKYIKSSIDEVSEESDAIILSDYLLI